MHESSVSGVDTQSADTPDYRFAVAKVCTLAMFLLKALAHSSPSERKMAKSCSLIPMPCFVQLTFMQLCMSGRLSEGNITLWNGWSGLQ